MSIENYSSDKGYGENQVKINIPGLKVNVDLPPSLEVISEEEFNNLPPVNEEAKEMIKEKFGNHVEIGETEGFSTKGWAIDGPLVWVSADSEYAIFRTSKENIKVLLSDLVGPSDKNRKEKR